MKKCDVFSIWLKYQERIHNYIRKRVHHPADSENILHTVLLKMHRYCVKSADVKNVSSWLYQIASNTIVDYYRDRQKFTEMGNASPWYTWARLLFQPVFIWWTWKCAVQNRERSYSESSGFRNEFFSRSAR